MLYVRSLCVVACGLWFGAAWAAPAASPPRQAAKNPMRTHAVTSKDYFSINYLWGGAALSPKGDKLAYVESRWSKKKRNADLWVVDTTTRRRTRLTFDMAADMAPSWGERGRWIYFVSRRKGSKRAPFRGKRQVWRIRPSGERLMLVTRASKGIASYQLSHDGKRLYYQTNVRKAQKGPFAKLRKRFPKLKYGHHKVSKGQIWVLDLESWHTRLLHASRRTVRSFRVSPDGSRVAMLTAPDRKLISNEGWSRVDIYDVKRRTITSPEPRQWRQKAPSPYGWLSGLRWSSDSRKLSFRVSFDGYPAEIYVLALQGTKVTSSRRLQRHKEAHLERGMAWRPGAQELCYVATHHAQNYLFCASFAGDAQGKTVTIPTGRKGVEGFHFSANGKRIVVKLSSHAFPCDLFVGEFKGAQTSLQRVTRVNPQIDTWKLPHVSTVWWKSKDGTPVEGVMELPPGVSPKKKPKKPLPLLVILHGGPTWSVKRRFRFGYHGRTRFAAKGWVTLSPNYRGSTGYGDKFLVELIGHKNNRDVADILSGVDALIQRGIADPNRMAIVGWSNGGYLVNCLITKTRRFKAASSGAGVFDTTMQWMIEDTPGHVINYSQGLPWKRRNAMAKSSPLFEIHKARTPTIIHIGERDARVPVQHGRALYRALRRYVGVPSQLIVYPGVYHGLRSRKHRTAKMSWDDRWFGHYVLRKRYLPKPKKRKKQKKQPTRQAPPSPPKGIKAS